MSRRYSRELHRAIPFRVIRLIITGLAGVFLSTPAVQSAPPTRPQVAVGTNNAQYLPVPHVPGLVTHDLNSGLTPTNLVTALLGPGITVSNVTFTGANVAAGTFSGGTGIIGFESGIMLSSGNIALAVGPNSQDAATANNGLGGDPTLNALIPGYITYDACSLQFDFTCTGTQVIQFQYVLSSEEYNEWVNSPFNDVFGFFLNGVNIAFIPGTTGTAVSINNLNCDYPYNPPLGSFCNLFINNRCADIPPGNFPCAGARDTEMDGLTVVLTATATLNPGQNHIKLAVADAGDQVLDSNVFIRGQSFVCGEPIGACCDTTSNTCVESVTQAACVGAGRVWSVGLNCSQLNPPCAPVVHPAGTDCANPINITSLPFSDTNTTFDKGNDYTSSCLGEYDNGLDILYRLTIPTAQCVDITVTGTTPNDNWIGIGLGATCPPGATCLAQGTSQGTVATITGLNLAAGTYYLMVDRWPTGSDGLNFTLSVTTCGGAATGACCNATTQVCTNNVLQANCMGADETWSAGLDCGQLVPPCNPEVDTDGQDCEFPLHITTLPFVDINTTSNKNEDYSLTCLGVYDDGNDIIYRVALASAYCVDITVSGATAADHFIGVVLDSSCPPGASCIAFATTPGTEVAINDLALDAGVYFLMIDRQPGPGGAEALDFRLTIAECMAPGGACCLMDGTCALQTEADCMSAGGLTWSLNTPCSPNPCAHALGDANCDNSVDIGDIPEFIAALLDQYTGCDIMLADMDQSGALNGGDIPLFVQAISGP